MSILTMQISTGSPATTEESWQAPGSKGFQQEEQTTEEEEDSNNSIVVLCSYFPAQTLRLAQSALDPILLQQTTF